MKKLLLGCAIGALTASSAYAQSTGSQEFEKEIVVTGTKGPQNVGGISTPETSKTREVLTQAFISHQTPGQSVDELINLVPGVSFQNNDGYGSAGGTLYIRGFDASRISQTFDGIPLNDTGNYALYSNQQIDPELIDNVTVSLGSTDIDSPTASATGSTVNYTTRTPSDSFHARLLGSIGQYHMGRIFGVIDTGDLTSTGTRAWFAASKQDYHQPFNNYGKINKQQYNAKLYQPIGDNGDFISIAGHFNQNLNNFFGSVPLRTDTTTLNTTTGAVTGVRVEGSTSGNRFPLSTDERFYNIPACTRVNAVGGTAQSEASSTSSLVQTAANCGTIFDYRFNPSRTANIRINSKFSITDKLTLTVDPFFEFTDANGGGTLLASEGLSPGTAAAGGGLAGYINNVVYTGVDLNGDGDKLDTLNVLAPSNTITHRYGVIANLLFDLSPSQTFRVNYTLDYGRHRQTGEMQILDAYGHPITVFPQGDPLFDVNGNVLQKRDRLSFAILNQVAAQYRGKFLDDKLTVDLGVRAPFFQRKLNNKCFTTSGGGFVDCLDENAAANAAYAAVPSHAGYAPPMKKNVHYNKVLPVGGLTYKFTPLISIYGSYSKGLQVPGTDDLYNAFYPNSPQPKPETSDNFDTGIRLRSGKIQAQGAFWYTIFHNRIESSYDVATQSTTYQNLGTVHKYGFDGSVSYKVDQHLNIYLFGSRLFSKILNDVRLGTCTSGTTLLAQAAAGLATTCSGAGLTIQTATTAGSPIYAHTGGKFESAASKYTFGGRLDGNLGPVQAGVTVKRNGPRYINDQNTPVFQSFGSGAGTTYYQVYGNKTPAYTTVDLDARVSLKFIGLNDTTFFQLNVINLFDKLYVGGFGSSASTYLNTSITNVQIGAPRTISGTVSIGF